MIFYIFPTVQYGLLISHFEHTFSTFNENIQSTTKCNRNMFIYWNRCDISCFLAFFLFFFIFLFFRELLQHFFFRQHTIWTTVHIFILSIRFTFCLISLKRNINTTTNNDEINSTLNRRLLQSTPFVPNSDRTH